MQILLCTGSSNWRPNDKLWIKSPKVSHWNWIAKIKPHKVESPKLSRQKCQVDTGCWHWYHLKVFCQKLALLWFNSTPRNDDLWTNNCSARALSYALNKTKTKTKKVKFLTRGKTKLGKAGHREKVHVWIDDWLILLPDCSLYTYTGRQSIAF